MALLRRCLTVVFSSLVFNIDYGLCFFSKQCISITDSDHSYFCNETGHCYYIWTDHYMFEDAKNKCEARSSYLVQLEDLNEQLWLHSVYIEQVWLGLQFKDSIWSWITSGQEVTLEDPRWLSGTIGNYTCKQSENHWARVSKTNGYRLVCETGSYNTVLTEAAMSPSCLTSSNQGYFTAATSGYWTSMTTTKEIKGLIECGAFCLGFQACSGIMYSDDKVCTVLELSSLNNDCPTDKQCYAVQTSC